MRSRRACLAELRTTASTHGGLWLDKFLYAQTEAVTGGARENGSRRNWRDEDYREDGVGMKALAIRQVSALRIPVGYRQAFDRRKKAFATDPDNVKLGLATSLGRLIVGLGQKGPIEAGLTLEHTWGIPMLPGSALKGLMSAAADQLMENAAWRKSGSADAAGQSAAASTKGESLAVLTGTLKRRGEVHFHDAWWQPPSSTNIADDVLPIYLDVMTVHHQRYYQEAQPAPSDMDSPTPVPFASVKGKFLIAVEGDPECCQAALTLLALGLSTLGIGAKTNSGYGRLRLELIP
ncbi:type III-B CRISPR module RAMP protein Cmr6 [Haliangium sp. UPWRP_2]|uniref:type III-B CRISPR module RAMP protein Cmr6 n=1 Tax=Haliangium sp. UPWRP_2 TaxID=1931276 RepID=UPI000D0CE1E8|nr:type III-B CRISPR module RAMP protein Cmr6 [Haliangium sp. UPWRP_2]PSM32304.1 type III-B CRISPR module RAMP protein Cmr6 [Haliangium sp. UPWRP_2]